MPRNKPVTIPELQATIEATRIRLEEERAILERLQAQAEQLLARGTRDGIPPAGAGRLVAIGERVMELTRETPMTLQELAAAIDAPPVDISNAINYSKRFGHNIINISSNDRRAKWRFIPREG